MRRGADHRRDRRRDHGRRARCDLRAPRGERAAHRVRGRVADRGLSLRSTRARASASPAPTSSRSRSSRALPADVFAAASPKYPDALYKQGLVEKPIPFATNTLVLIVPKSNPAGIHSVDDLTKPGVKIVIGDRRCRSAPIRATVLNNLGISAAVAEERRQPGDRREGRRREGRARRGRRRLRLRDRRQACTGQGRPRSRSASRRSRTSSTRSPW